MKKTVIIVEDDQALSKHLVWILQSSPDISCLGSYGSGEMALPEILKRKPDVVLMEISLPGKSGIECVAEIRRTSPAVQVIMVTDFEDVTEVLRALKAGAGGCLIKPSPADELLEAIRNVCQGGAPMSNSIARKLVEYIRTVETSSAKCENLTPRQGQVLDLLSRGYKYREIGERLEIGNETVRTHVATICKKLCVRNRIEAVSLYRAGCSQPFPISAPGSSTARDNNLVPTVTSRIAPAFTCSNRERCV